ncbi:MAG: hypothetical protein LBK25_02680 [Treponema sp.]|nr:hypothetical protein [Treponema sp.]
MSDTDNACCEGVRHGAERCWAAVSDIRVGTPLACKRSRQDGVSGATFRTTPRGKSSNTRRVQRRPLFGQQPL